MHVNLLKLLVENPELLNFQECLLIFIEFLISLRLDIAIRVLVDVAFVDVAEWTKLIIVILIIFFVQFCKRGVDEVLLIGFNLLLICWPCLLQYSLFNIIKWRLLLQ
jgi:hypothetical protein